jgi:hypothetical protein
LYHKSGQRAAAIVAGVADPSFKARLLTLGVEANPPRFGLALDVIFGEGQAARSPGDNPGFNVCLRFGRVSSRELAECFGDTCPEGFRGRESNFLG